MPPDIIDFDQLKQRLRSTWMAGDFGQIAQYTAHDAEDFVSRLPIRSDMQVLDVACGTGNLTIPAARTGARVTGLDIAPNLLEQARLRAESESLHIAFQEGDAEQLPYPDRSFALVMSMFGAMFAPRPELVAQELMRVCQPGGVVAMANWTPQGFAGKMFSLTARHVPHPGGIPAPALWGEEAVVRQRLGSFASNIQMVRRKLLFAYPFPPEQVVQFFRQYFGPTRVAFSKLDEPAQLAYAADLEKLWRDNNQAGDSKTLVQTEYLEVIATRA